MNTTTKALRRSLAAVFAASAVGGVTVAVLAVPSQPPRRSLRGQ